MADIPSSDGDPRRPGEKISIGNSNGVNSRATGIKEYNGEQASVEDENGEFTGVGGGKDHEDYGEDNGGEEDEDDENEDEDERKYLLNEKKGDGRKDFYTILNVPRDATSAQLRTAYHDLSLIFHPDKQPPDLRPSATHHFNLIKKAFETLSDPHKRTAYDMLGEEGTKVSWDVGIKAMTPEEFKVWLMNRVKRSRKEKIESLVGSMGVVICTVDARKLFDGLDDEEEEFVGRAVQSRKPKTFMEKLGMIAMTRFFIQHTFHVPLPRLLGILNTPLDPRKVVRKAGGQNRKEDEVEEEEEEVSSKPNNIEINPPHLRITASLGGTRVVAVTEGPQGEKTGFGDNPLLGQGNLEFNLSHAFPPSEVLASLNTQRRRKSGEGKEEKEYPSISSIMQSCQVSLTHQVFSRLTTLGLTRPILNRRVGMNVVGHFFHGARKSLPSFEITFTRPMTRTGTMFFVYATGNRWNIKLPYFGEIGSWTKNLPGNGSTKIGYTSRQSPGIIEDVEDEEDDFEEEWEDDFEESKRREQEYQEEDRNIPKKKDRKTGNQAVVIALSANQLGNGLTTIGIGFDYARTFFASANPPTYISPDHDTPRILNSARGIRISVKSGFTLLGDLSFSISGTRPVGNFSRLGIELSLGGPDSQYGLLWSFTWRRLGQKISIPMLVSSFRNSEDIVEGWYLGTKIALACLSLYGLAEFMIVRRREQMERMKKRRMRKDELRRRIEKDKKEAETVIALMKETILRRQAGERERGGLVVLFATYGVKQEEWKGLGRLKRRKGKKDEGERRIDVTIPVGAMVDNGQMAIRKGVRMSQLPGFYDPAPYQPKTLEVHYLFRGIEHRVEVKDGKGLVIPSKSHIVN